MIVRFDQSTFLAFRAQAVKDPPPVPKLVALPGAKAPVATDRLAALQDAGHDQHAIVARVNRRWEQANAATLQAHRGWVSHAYHPGLQRAREAKARADAEDMRRRARLAQLLGED